jgi:hypothetical protein
MVVLAYNLAQLGRRDSYGSVAGSAFTKCPPLLAAPAPNRFPARSGLEAVESSCAKWATSGSWSARDAGRILRSRSWTSNILDREQNCCRVVNEPSNDEASTEVHVVWNYGRVDAPGLSISFHAKVTAARTLA